MGAQFGRWYFDGREMQAAELDRVRSLLSLYGPDGSGEYGSKGLSLLWSSFETTDANPGKQPWVLDSGEVLVWDGRLDNREDLAGALGIPQSDRSPDVQIAARAWSRWAEDCFARLIGDWAFSLWDPHDRRLTLAADIPGTRHLFYTMESECIRWSSVLEPLVLLSAKSLNFDEEYLAGWLASFPGAHLTPYREIHRVPPASLVIVRPGSRMVRRYWAPDGGKRIRYARDGEYQEHFLGLLRQAVNRRLRASTPVLAELSGGMDSSAIVCTADQLTSASGRPQIETVSYYNDNEPHWNERPWFEKVEAYRGKTGLHIDLTVPAPSAVAPLRLPCRPGAAAGLDGNPLVAFMMQNRHRVLLSGIGGDEFLGGVPTPLPELEDLFARARFVRLWRHTLEWALVQRRPWIHLLGAAVEGFLPPRWRPRSRGLQAAVWLDTGFVRRQPGALASYPVRWRLHGPLPSFQENVDALDGIRRQLGCADPAAGYPYERRYPLLDRNLLEFLFALPRDQLVRPGERRSLMRRSLRGIVPDELLNRKRKAYISRAHIRVAEEEYRNLLAGEGMVAAEMGILNRDAFLHLLDAARRGEDAPAIPLLRALALEQWLRDLTKYRDPAGAAEGKTYFQAPAQFHPSPAGL